MPTVQTTAKLIAELICLYMINGRDKYLWYVSELLLCISYLVIF